DSGQIGSAEFNGAQLASAHGLLERGDVRFQQLDIQIPVSTTRQPGQQDRQKSNTVEGVCQHVRRPRGIRRIVSDECPAVHRVYAKPAALTSARMAMV